MVGRKPMTQMAGAEGRDVNQRSTSVGKLLNNNTRSRSSVEETEFCDE